MTQNAQLKVLPHKSDLRDTLDAFLIDGQVRRLSQKTLGFYSWELNRALLYLESRGVTTLAGITPTHLRSYLLSEQDRGLSAGSQHASARSLRAWLNWCVREELVDASPMSKVRMPRRERTILPAFSASDVAQLLGACETTRDTAMVLTLLDSGVRAAEFCALNVVDVNLFTGSVHVRRGKGQKERITYVNANARSAVRIMLAERGNVPEAAPLFVSDTSGARLTTSGLGAALERIGKRADVQHSHPHTFRRSFAVWSLRSGMDLYRLARLMGHSDISVLRAYLSLAQDDLEKAHHDHGALETMLRASVKGGLSA